WAAPRGHNQRQSAGGHRRAIHLTHRRNTPQPKLTGGCKSLLPGQPPTHHGGESGMNKPGVLATGLLLALSLGAMPALAADKGGQVKRCNLQSIGNKIQQVVHIQFDNVHLRRDNPNVPSDLEQMPNLLNFMQNDGTMFTDHHTPLISHTAVDILTVLTGAYGDRFGIPIGNSLRYFNPDGTTNGMSSFAY